MKSSFTLRLGLALLALAVLPAVAGAESAMEIVKKSDDLMRGAKSYARFSMTVTRPEWTREMQMEAWTRGVDDAFVRTLAPAKEKGTTFLKKGREGWNYVPAIDRTIKIPPSMMLQSWMGSDFTNDDLMRADSLVVDYTHAIAAETTDAAGVKAWQIVLTPKPNAAVVWAKVVLTIRQTDYVASRCEYYNDEGELVKHFETSDIRAIEGQRIPLRFKMVDDKKAGCRTEIVYSTITFKPTIPADLFTLESLRQRGR